MWLTCSQNITNIAASTHRRSKFYFLYRVLYDIIISIEQKHFHYVYLMAIHTSSCSQSLLVATNQSSDLVSFRFFGTAKFYNHFLKEIINTVPNPQFDKTTPNNSQDQHTIALSKQSAAEIRYYTFKLQMRTIYRSSLLF